MNIWIWSKQCEVQRLCILCTDVQRLILARKRLQWPQCRPPSWSPVCTRAYVSPASTYCLTIRLELCLPNLNLLNSELSHRLLLLLGILLILCFLYLLVYNLLAYMRQMGTTHVVACWDVFKALNRNSGCCIRTREGLTDMFDIVSGVKQGCILSPFLFFMVIDFVMRKTMEGKDFGISWDHWRLADLDFADDIELCLITLTEPYRTWQIPGRLHGHRKKVGLRISNGKTKTMTVGKQHVMPSITLDNWNIENVHRFQYLGSYVAEDGDVEVDIRTRIGKALSVFQRLQPIWKCGAISKIKLLRLYSSIIVPSSSSNLCLWNMEDKTTAKATKMFDVFHLCCLRRILGISWHDHITNNEVMIRFGQTALHDIVATRRRRFIGHILWLPRTRLARLAIE